MHREAKNPRNTLCISRFFNKAGRKICRQDVCGDLFSASLKPVFGERLTERPSFWAAAFALNKVILLFGISVQSSVQGYFSIACWMVMPSATAAERWALVAWISFIFAPVRE